MANGAAAAARKRQQEEEEETRYSREQMSQNLEFKILRSMTGAFRDPESMKHAVDEEATNGWALLEKFDSCRMRFVRPRNWAGRSENKIDPYRTVYRISPGLFTLLVLTASLAFSFVLVVVIVASK